ncbi:cysteine--tRNA ligase [Fimbriimonadia bacterium ATM]|nr:MAG: cysteine--tRNA ligase [Armatimonadota bacterium]MBC6969793.1 cysteine--tRNA ligase [Armatimonadota bacterium]MCE7899061.1 cysteine--tRNA ligase [Armatimonadetes bacterium ATM1]MDL1927516.1 cysteine--tRNA ligase [Fimbriimonadia bacterium ATM]RIJ95992.1 MAG: cysteine--tRNA ligase [Armatimonadota bacterium]
MDARLPVKSNEVPAVRLYDTLTRQTVTLQPRDPDRVSIYTCGLTPQGAAHVGHMRGAVFFDVVRRWLEELGYEVAFVQNFTDIDDKIIRRSSEEGIEPAEVAKKYVQLYLEDLKLLGVRPAKWVYVTENMDAIIEMVQKLVEGGHAYVAEGDVYFRVESMPEYGKLSHRRLNDMQAGARIDVDERKEHPMDFALWKAAKQGEPSWDSPWGPGRPGWHIECSALSLKELGPNFDIHAGGVDLVFPHHENEIAQSEAYLGRPEFARIWMHWGAVRLAERKMSKSEGNVLAARQAVETFGSGAVRLFLLSTGYRSPIEYSDERVAEAKQALARVHASLDRARQVFGDPDPAGPKSDAHVANFSQAMSEDFNTPGAIAALHGVIGELNDLLADGAEDRAGRASELVRTAEWMMGILGFEADQEGDFGQLTTELMRLIVGWRNEMRRERLYAFADRVRDDLKEVGIVLEDSVEGTTWRRS